MRVRQQNGTQFLPGLATAFCFLACALAALAQQPPVTIQVELVRANSNKPAGPAADNSNAVVWLTPLDTSAVMRQTRSGPPPRLVQKKKSFEPHVLVVQVGAEVIFPNEDPFFHNVFSLFDGKRFDLGLYEAGSSKSVRFDRPGVSFLFCNIHPEMSAAVVAVETPYFGVSDHAGRVSIGGVPDGRYQLQVWSERSLTEDLKKLAREVAISDAARTLETLQIAENPNFTLAHKNKYGQDYVPPASGGYIRH